MRFHGRRHPRDMEPCDVVKREVGASMVMVMNTSGNMGLDDSRNRVDKSKMGLAPSHSHCYHLPSGKIGWKDPVH